MSDFSQASKIASLMVTKFGMSEKVGFDLQQEFCLVLKLHFSVAIPFEKIPVCLTVPLRFPDDKLRTDQ